MLMLGRLLLLLLLLLLPLPLWPKERPLLPLPLLPLPLGRLFPRLSR